MPQITKARRKPAKVQQRSYTVSYVGPGWRVSWGGNGRQVTKQRDFEWHSEAIAWIREQLGRRGND